MFKGSNPQSMSFSWKNVGGPTSLIYLVDISETKVDVEARRTLGAAPAKLGVSVFSSVRWMFSTNKDSLTMEKDV